MILNKIIERLPFRYDSLYWYGWYLGKCNGFSCFCLPIPKMIRIYVQNTNPLVKQVHSFIDEVEKQTSILVLSSIYARLELMIDING